MEWQLVSQNGYGSIRYVPQQFFLLKRKIGKFCSALEDTLTSLPTSHTKLVLNDFAVEVGKVNDNDGHYSIVGIHVLGIRNEHGGRLFQFCAERQNVLENLC